MINIEAINKEIMDLEKKDTSYAVCERLAWLYIVRDHLMGDEDGADVKTASEAPTGIHMDGDSEFMKAIQGKSVEDVICTIDELMESVSIVQPKLYAAVLRKFAE